jgi:peroxiredoxin
MTRLPGKWWYGAAVTLCGAVISATWAWQPRPVEAPALPRPSAVEKHYVTPRQLAAAGSMQGSRATSLSALSEDNVPVAWAELVDGQPLLIVFIKNGCPCSVEFEPFFHRLERAYRRAVRFVGLIDGEPDDARRYRTANAVPYPILADPTGTVAEHFHAENGGYVALLDRAGAVDTLWPGCSAEMMQQLGRRAAELAGVEERPLDLTGLPRVLTTGCPYVRPSERGTP